MTETMTVKDAASTLGVHVNTIRNFMGRGDLAFQKLPSGARRPLASDVVRIAKAMTPAHEAAAVQMADELDELATRLQFRARALRAAAQRLRS